MSLENTSMEDVCRVCLEKSGKLYPLIGRIPNVDEDISSMITYCTSIEIIIEDNLPTAVCVPCFRTLRIAYNFICQFKESNRKLLENRDRNNDTACKIDCNEQEKSIQDYDNENGEEIIIEYKDFYNYVISDANNASIMQKSGENEEIQVIDETFPFKEEEMCIECKDDFEQNTLETNVVEEPCKEYEDFPELQNELSNMPQSSFIMQKNNSKGTICPICGQSFVKFETGFVKHLLTHKDVKFKCNKCSLGMVLTVDLYIQHFRKAHRFECEICSKSYGQRSGLYYHLKTHTAKRIFKCSYKHCTKAFLTAWCLRKHLHTHSESAKYICSKCGSEFKTYGSYKYHQRTHDGNRNYLCTVCGQTFLQSIHLKYHMWKHTGIKLFQCDKCNKSYTSQTQLKKHRKKKICEAIILTKRLINVD